MNHEWPENDKLAVVVKERNAILEFLDWLHQEHGIQLCDIPDGYDFTYLPIRVQHERLVMEFFQIDERKLEEERRNMLRALRVE